MEKAIVLPGHSPSVLARNRPPHAELTAPISPIRASIMTANPPAEQPPDPDGSPSAEHATPSQGADRGTTPNELEDTTAAALPKLIPFESLCRCGDEVWIENHGVIYRLRRTRQGKLILTK